MRRRDWLKSILAVCAAAPAGLRAVGAVAATATPAAALPDRHKADKAKWLRSAKRDALRTSEMLPVFGGSLDGNTWHYGYGRGLLMVPTHGFVVSGVACEWYERKTFAVLVSSLSWETREAWVYIGRSAAYDPPPRGQLSPDVHAKVERWLMSGGAT